MNTMIYYDDNYTWRWNVNEKKWCDEIKDEYIWWKLKYYEDYKNMKNNE